MESCDRDGVIKNCDGPGIEIGLVAGAGFCLFTSHFKMSDRGGRATRSSNRGVNDDGCGLQTVETVEDLRKYMMEVVGELRKELEEARNEVRGTDELRQELAEAKRERNDLWEELRATKKQLEDLKNVKKEVGVLQEQSRSYSEVVGQVAVLRESQEGLQEERTKEREDRVAQAESMKAIMDEQKRAREEGQKSRSVSPREARLESERTRSVRVTGLPEVEASLPNYQERQGSLRRELDKILEVVCIGGQAPRVIDVRRLGGLGEADRGPRPVLVRFDKESEARDVLVNSWRLSKSEGLRRVYVDKDMSKEERRHAWELRREAKTKNEARTAEERACYFFAVRGGKVRQRFRTEDRTREERNNSE